MWGSPLPHTGLHDEQVLALHLLEQGCQPTLLISKCLFQEMLHVVELRVARSLPIFSKSVRVATHGR